MPIIREEINSKTETEQKLNFNKAKLKVIKYHNTVTAKKEPTNFLRSVAPDSTLHKIEQNENVQISKLAESMAKMTEATLRKIEQHESVKISKMIENMHKMTKINIDQLQQIPDYLEIDLKEKSM